MEQAEISSQTGSYGMTLVMDPTPQLSLFLLSWSAVHN